MKQKVIYFLIFILLCGAGYIGLTQLGIFGSDETIYKIGLVSGGKPFEANSDGFIEKMTELGYVQGVNVTYDVGTTSGAESEVRSTIERFISDNVDIIVTFPTEPSVIAKELTAENQIPVVFSFASVEDIDLVDSVLVPGGNITGVRYPNPEITLKRYEFLRMIMPDLENLLLIFDHDYPAALSALRVLQEATKNDGTTLTIKNVATISDLDAVFQTLEETEEVADIDAIFVMPEILTHSPAGWGLLSEFAKKHDIPVAGTFEYTLQTGAMFGYVPDNRESGALAAFHADKILQGIDPGSIPLTSVESRLIVNISQIESHNLHVPAELLNQAVEVLQ